MSAITWVPVKGYEGVYEVSDDGQVRSLDREILWRDSVRKQKGKVLSPRFNRRGYARVVLHKNGLGEEGRVHRLVAEAFLGSPPVGKPYVNHIDHNPSNNLASNLEWVSQAENVQHSARHGRMQAETNPNCSGKTNPNLHPSTNVAKRMKLSPEIVTAVREMSSAGVHSQRSIGDALGLSQSMVSLLVRNKSWVAA